jgi:exonuclease VII large subunit
MKETSELKEARKRIRELETALANAHIENCLERGFLKTACIRLGENVEDFKKKADMTVSFTPKRVKEVSR